jgi:hypothetical protein
VVEHGQFLGDPVERGVVDSFADDRIGEIADLDRSAVEAPLGAFEEAM